MCHSIKIKTTNQIKNYVNMHYMFFQEKLKYELRCNLCAPDTAVDLHSGFYVSEAGTF